MRRNPEPAAALIPRAGQGVRAIAAHGFRGKGIYAVFHCPSYRSRFEPMLKLDFPRVPPPVDGEQFTTLVPLGRQLLAAHLLEDESLAGDSVAYPANGDNVVAKGYPKYVPPGSAAVKAGGAKLEPDAEHGRVYISPEQYFEGIEPAVWQFQIGGYQVAEKWLKDRRGRTLSYDDLTTYPRIIEALRRTIDLMHQIDQVPGPWADEAAGV